MNEKPLLSIAVLAGSGHHFLHRTLETLSSQEQKNFEIVLLDSRDPREWAKFRADVPVIAERLTDGSLSKQMNQAIALSSGRYIQFLHPGEYLLSQQATAYMEKVASENDWPEIVYGAFLQTDPVKPPRAATYPLRLLSSGVDPTLLPAHWFLKSALVGIGGFNLRYSYRPSFDALCSLMQKKARAVYTRHVLVDGQWRGKTALETASFAFETCESLFRHFGVRRAIRWLFVQDRRQMLRRLWKKFKDAFRKV